MRQKTNEPLKAREERVWRYVARFLSVAHRFRAHARTVPLPRPHLSRSTGRLKDWSLGRLRDPAGTTRPRPEKTIDIAPFSPYLTPGLLRMQLKSSR
jgi:hypothetical protein